MTRHAFIGGCTLLVLVLTAGLLSAQEPERVRQLIEALRSKAKELKQEGRVEDAARVHAEAEKLAQQAKAAPPKKDGDKPNPDKPQKQVDTKPEKVKAVKEPARGEKVAKVPTEAKKPGQPEKAAPPKKDVGGKPNADKPQKQAEAKPDKIKAVKQAKEPARGEKVGKAQDEAKKHAHGEKVVAQKKEVGGEPNLDQLRKHIEAMAHKVQELKEQGRLEEATKVAAEAEKLTQHAKAIHHQQASGGQPKGEQVQAQIEMMNRKARELKEQGRVEEAAKVHEHAEQLARKFKEAGQKLDLSQKEKHPGGEREHHVRAAIEHLHAAGLGHLADELIAKLKQGK